MKTHPSRIMRVLGAFLAAFVIQSISFDLKADPPARPPVIEFATGLPGKQVRLSWSASRGHRYHVERSEDLSPGSWRRVAQVTGNGANSVWLDPEAVKTRCFYRVTEPGPEVFSVEPPLLSENGGALEILGQNLPPSGSLAMDIEGLGRIVTPFTEVIDGDGNTRWRVVLNGPFTAGARVSNVAILNAVGEVATQVDLSLTVTADGCAADSPAALPPGAPLGLGVSKPVPGIGIVVKKHPSGHPGRDRTMSDGFWNDWAECLILDGQGGSGDQEGGSGVGWMSKKGYDYYQSQSGKLNTVKNNPLYKGKGIRTNPLAEQHRISPATTGLPGEVSFHYDALSLSNFAGPPLAWIMTYRSTRPVSSGHGPQWDFSYNIRIDAASSSAPRVTVHDGGGRADVFHR